MSMLSYAVLEIPRHTYHVFNLLQAFKDRLDLVYRFYLKCSCDYGFLQGDIGC